MLHYSYSNALPVPAGSGQEFTVRLIHEVSGRFIAVVNGEVILTSDDSDATTLFKKTTPKRGYVRLQSVANPGEYLLFNDTEGVDTTWYTVGVPEDAEEGSGSGASTQVHSDWKTVNVDDHIVQLRVNNQNDDECYLAADFNGVFPSNPCDASLGTQGINVYNTFINIREVVSVEPQ